MYVMVMILQFTNNSFTTDYHILEYFSHTFSLSLMIGSGFRSLSEVPLLKALANAWCLTSTRFGCNQYNKHVKEFISRDLNKGLQTSQ